MKNFLDEVLPYKRGFVENLADIPSGKLTPSKLDFLAAVAATPEFRQHHSPQVIAELKAKSPVKGVMDEHADPVAIAKQYTEGGAAAISVLTDEAYFNGSFATLALVREATKLPLLCKDFIIDEKQIRHARLAGANAVLLIVRILSDEAFKRLKAEIERFNMLAMIEIYDEEDLARALTVNPHILLINNRDLKTLEMHAHSETLIHKIPQNIPVVLASGLNTPESVRILSPRFCAALIGTALMLAKDKIAFLKACHED